MPEGHQSPPPERQSKDQMGGTGKKTDDHETGKSGKEQLEVSRDETNPSPLLAGPREGSMNSLAC